MSFSAKEPLIGAFLRKMTYADKPSYGSSLPCRRLPISKFFWQKSPTHVGLFFTRALALEGAYYRAEKMHKMPQVAGHFPQKSH